MVQHFIDIFEDSCELTCATSCTKTTKCTCYVLTGESHEFIFTRFTLTTVNLRDNRFCVLHAQNVIQECEQ